ncbi:MAG: universal stress protein [Halobacteriota archaeon]
MPVNILVPADGSSHSLAGLVYTFVSFPNATVTVLHVRGSEQNAHPEFVTQEHEEKLQPTSDRIIERTTEIASAYDREVETVVSRGQPHRVILEYIAQHGIDHVVMGSHGQSPNVRPFLGHVTEAVIRRAPISTTVIPESRPALLQREFPGRILVPVDGSEQSLAALEYTVERFPDGRITLFHAIAAPFGDEVEAIDEGLGEFIESLTRRGETVLKSAVQTIEDDDLVVETDLGHGKPARSIIDYAVERAFDQIIMGSHGRPLPARIILGSVAETVSRRSTIPVTLIKDRSE